MEKKMWEIQFLSLPHIWKYCKKCGRKTAFTCSEQFRINAQQKHLDIWLIYKCLNCNATWNAAIFSRVSLHSLNAKMLEQFHRNDGALVEQYAMDYGFLRRNGVEVELPQYSVIGDTFSLDETIELKIKSKYFFPVKVSSLIMDRLHISQKEYSQLVIDGKIKSIDSQDLQKSKLKNGITLVFNEKSGDKTL